MHITNFISEYAGNVPNRASDTPIAFADNVYTYQVWIDEHFAPESKTLSENINSVADYIDEAARTVEDIVVSASNSASTASQAAITALEAANGGDFADSILKGAVGNVMSPLLDLPLLNSLDMKAGVGSVTFTRATTATYIDRYGVLKTAAVDEPRFEKDGLLIEGQSTNELLHNDSPSANWQTTASGVGSAPIITDNYGTSIDNTNNAHRVQFSLNGGTLTTDQSNLDFTDFESTIDESFCSSVWIKSTNGLSTYNMRYDLSGINSDLLGTTSDITVTGEWQRFKVGLLSPQDIYRKPKLRLLGTLTDDTADILVCFAQTERLPFATSYIPTTDSAVTRANDICFIDEHNNTVNTKFESISMSCDLNPIGFIEDNNFRFVLQNSKMYVCGMYIYNRYARYKFGLSSRLISGLLENTKTRLTASYESFGDTGISNGYYNGAKTQSESETTNSISNGTKISIGCDKFGNNQINGCISNVRIYNFLLTPTEVALLG